MRSNAHRVIDRCRCRDRSISRSMDIAIDRWVAKRDRDVTRARASCSVRSSSIGSHRKADANEVGRCDARCDAMREVSTSRAVSTSRSRARGDGCGGDEQDEDYSYSARRRRRRRRRRARIVNHPRMVSMRAWASARLGWWMRRCDGCARGCDGGGVARAFEMRLARARRGRERRHRARARARGVRAGVRMVCVFEYFVLTDSSRVCVRWMCRLVCVSSQSVTSEYSPRDATTNHGRRGGCRYGDADAEVCGFHGANVCVYG